MGIGDDTGTAIQNQNLIGDDVASEISQAMSSQMSGSVTPPTIVEPTQHHSAPMIPGNDQGVVNTPDEPATDAHHPSDDTPATPVSSLPPEPTEFATSQIAEPSHAITDSDTKDDTDSSAVDDLAQTGSGNFTELQDIKVQALRDLGPLVEHIDQDPEERFNTLIMMIRSSDDERLIKPAFEAAKSIPDDKKRADALLDVINEINYLTRPQADSNQ